MRRAGGAACAGLGARRGADSLAGMPEPDPARSDATPAVTIYDVAREAGVAPSTVSRAFSRPGRVNAETGERIRQIAERLGYRAKPQARAAAPRRTSMLAVVLADLANPVFYELVRGAGSACEDAGYTMMLAETAESAEPELVLIVWSLDDRYMMERM